MSDATTFVSDAVRARRSQRKGFCKGSLAISTPLVCRDGFEMSVQASAVHRSTPRTVDGPWSEFEVGFLTQDEPLLALYAEDEGTLTETVYNYVPANIVLAVIEKHGGLAQ